MTSKTFTESEIKTLTAAGYVEHNGAFHGTRNTVKVSISFLSDLKRPYALHILYMDRTHYYGSLAKALSAYVQAPLE